MNMSSTAHGHHGYHGTAGRMNVNSTAHGHHGHHGTAGRMNVNSTAHGHHRHGGHHGRAKEGDLTLRHESIDWILLITATLAILALEECLLKDLASIELRVAALWAVLFATFAVGACGLTLALLEGVQAATQYVFCLVMNAILSPDNLVVFMVFLRGARLPPDLERKGISHGMALAILLRQGAMLGGAALLDHFAWIKILLSALIIISGVRLCWAGDEDTEGSSVAEEADFETHWSVRALSKVLPLYWAQETGGAYLARDGRGRLCATRMAAVVVAIGFSDLTFAMDSITVTLGMTHSPLILIASQALSMLFLRPCYFLVAALLSSLGAMNSALAVILILIGSKLVLGLCGVQVPLWVFITLLTASRIFFGVRACLRERWADAAAI